MAIERIILGTQSPRRRELMSQFTLPFEQISSGFDESQVIFTGDPASYAQEIAEGKSRTLASKYKNDIILTADTVVYKDGKIYGKPDDLSMASQFLQELIGEWHSVYTAVTVCKGPKMYSRVEETKVLFNDLPPELITTYHNKMHWADKAGGYDIRMAGGLLIKRIDGCYYNVIGLPINLVRDLLKNFNIELWDYLKNGQI